MKVRRGREPEQVRAVSLARGERRLAWALGPAGPVVATDRALHLPGVGALAWGEIERAVWSAPVLTVVELAETAGAGRRHQVTVDLGRDTELPLVVRDQMAASVVWSGRVTVQPQGGARLIGRRAAGRDELTWQVVFDPGTDPGAPGVREQVEQQLAAVRRSVG